MAPSIGLNLRVTGYCNQGGRKYMEDVFSVAYQQTEGEKDLEYAFFGIFDGHGGREAALFAKEHLMEFIVRQKGFWDSDDESILKAIHDGFIQTHQAMWKELESWPKTASGLPSTAGTTASIAFIRRSKIYIGHVGDSAIVLGVQDPHNPHSWTCEPLTKDHKPESVEESNRITRSGGKVICKSGVPRVVWNRPKMGHKGPIRRSTPIDEIPFLAVARSLGDLWSYNSEEDVFVVSPEPDTYVYPIDILKHRCLILATDGAWNMISPQQAVSHVCQAEKANEQHTLNPSLIRQWINPSKHLVDKAIERWNLNNLRADNTSVVTVMFDPPGPPRALVLKRQRELAQLNSATPNIVDAASSARGSVALVTNTTPEESIVPSTPTLPPPPPSSTPLPPPPPVAAASSIVPELVPDPNNKPLSNNDLPTVVVVSKDLKNVPEENQSYKDSKKGGDTSNVHSPSHHGGSSSSQSSCSLKHGRSRSSYEGAIQCNEISSSDESPSASIRSHKDRVLLSKPLKESYLSRELNALKMDNTPGFQSRRRIRKHNSEASFSSNTSDTENEEHSANRSPQKRILRSSSILPSSEFSSHSLTTSGSSPCKKKKMSEDSSRRCGGGNNNSARRPVPQEEEAHNNTHFLRSSQKSLRGQKRKLRSHLELPPSKSSLGGGVVLSTKEPVVVTRSKSARVLQIKK